jgi:hypothetical protein
MDSHQGAGFAFDMNMDFSTVFATKPNEGETSNSFFGDEGIDTTGFSQSFDTMNSALLLTPQTGYDLNSSLVRPISANE